MVHRSRGRPSPAEGNNKIKIAARPLDWHSFSSKPEGDEKEGRGG